MPMSLTSTSTGRGARRCASASGAEAASATLRAGVLEAPTASSSRASASSSTTSTRRPARCRTDPANVGHAPSSARSDASASPRARGRRTLNVAPLPFALALRRDGAAVQLDQVAHDAPGRGPRPAVRARRGAVGLAEALEDVRQELGLMPAPGVRHREHPSEPCAPPADTSTRPPVGRELDRVGEQVPDAPAAAGRGRRAPRAARARSRVSSVTPLACAAGPDRLQRGLAPPRRRSTGAEPRSRSLPATMRETSSRSSISCAWSGRCAR